MEAENPKTPTTDPVPPPRRFGLGALLFAALLSAGASTGITLYATGHLGAVESFITGKSGKYGCPMDPQVISDEPGKCPICHMKLVELTHDEAAVPEAAANKAGASTASTSTEQGKYQCPMHPTIVQDRPGDCPICGMKLVPVQGQKAANGERKIVYYRSPMDPKQTSREPRKDEMGMDYLPVYEDELLGQTTVEGMATVNIDPARQQLIGLRTEAAVRASVGSEWRTVGRVAVDETRVRHINIRVPAYVEEIYVDYVGKAVRKGEALFSVYSPELLSAQEELLLALRSEAAFPSSKQTPGGEGPMVAAARRKLELWNVPDAEIQKILQTQKPLRAITLYSPIAGVVTKKDVVQGTQLDVGAMPYEVVDLSRVWVLADVYESELRRLKMGMPASFTLKAFPGRVFEGTVSFVAPLLNPETRTTTVRLAFANPTGELRPDMFGEVVLRAPERQGLRIPRDAVIHSGTRSVVFVALGEGKFQPREVQLGESDSANIEVISGLNEGDQVVTRANFLVDSESHLRASLAALAPSASKDHVHQELEPQVPGSPEPTPVKSPEQGTKQKASASKSTEPHKAPARKANANTSAKPPAEAPPAEVAKPQNNTEHSEHAGHEGHSTAPNSHAGHGGH